MTSRSPICSSPPPPTTAIWMPGIRWTSSTKRWTSVDLAGWGACRTGFHQRRAQPDRGAAHGRIQCLAQTHRPHPAAGSCLCASCRMRCKKRAGKDSEGRCVCRSAAARRCWAMTRRPIIDAAAGLSAQKALTPVAPGWPRRLCRRSPHRPLPYQQRIRRLGYGACTPSLSPTPCTARAAAAWNRRDLMRGIFDAAMSIYLDRFLNLPSVRLPATRASRRMPDNVAGRISRRC